MRSTRIVLIAGLVCSLFALTANADDKEFLGKDSTGHPCKSIVHIDKMTSTPEAAVGDTVTQTIFVHNIGTCNLREVRLRDSLSPYAAFVSASGSPANEPAVGGQGGYVAWEFALPAGTSVGFTVTVTLLPTPFGYWKDTACARLHDDKWGSVCDTLIIREIAAPSPSPSPSPSPVAEGEM